jgi:ABC-2 type transport system ATP-binding protein
MSEADEPSDLIAIIDRGRIIGSGTPPEIKRQFSRVAVMEVICRRTGNELLDGLHSATGVERIITSSDGPIRKLTIHSRSGVQIREEVVTILEQYNIESIITRDPTLEEAYLSVFKKPG